MVDAIDGPGRWAFPADRLSDLATVRARAAPDDTFKLLTDPHFIDKVHDVVGLYLNPPERAIVICDEEKIGIQALDRTQPSFPMLPGSPATATHDYERNGTVDLFAALNIDTGEVIIRLDNSTVPSSSASSWTSSPTTCPTISTCTSSQATRRPTRHRSSRSGCNDTPIRVALHPGVVVVAQPRRAMVR